METPIAPNDQPQHQQAPQSGGFAPRRRNQKQGKGGQQGQTPSSQPNQPPQQSANAKAAKVVSVDTLLETEKVEEMPGIAMKTPVSVLQELLSRRGITPSYELVQIEGAIHEPTFRYRVSFNDKEVPFTAMGAGRSKKEAKHAAARALIEKLTGVQMPENHSASNGEVQTVTPSKTAEQSSFNDEKVMGNPIGWLQEMCMSRRWPPPTYETEMEVGLPHERQFTIACTISKYREVGKGKSKKVAKRLAAHKMWTRLQESPLDNAQVSQSADEDNDENRTILSRYGELKDAHVSTLTSQYSQKVAQFHKTLKGATGTKLVNLQGACLKDPTLNYVNFLEEIANEQQFEVTYVDVEEKSFSGRAQCLVQLSTLPVAVCHGSGLTSKDAQSNSAHNALEYLKIMTKK